MQLVAHAIETPEPAALQTLNDRFRQTFQGGKVMLTPTVTALSLPSQVALFEAMRCFENFSPDNDPYGEHDFGAVQHEGERYFWKIDCYDRALQFGSPDPADPDVTTRVMTIMHSSEY